MIWYIIAGSLLLICILILLAGTWEVSIVEAYYFDETGQYFVDLKDTDYTVKQAAVLEYLKRKYPDKYKSEEAYAKKYSPQSTESYILSEMRYCEIPANRVVYKQLTVRDYWPDTYRFIGGVIASCICLSVLAVMGGTTAANKIKWAVDTQTTAYEEKIIELENNKQYITTYYSTGVNKDIDISSTNIPAVIKEHNAEVKDLLKEIKVNRINLDNPWISPWVNPACNNVDLARIEATYINTLS